MRRLLYWFAQTTPGTAVLAWLLARMSFVLPARRLRQTSTLVAFTHPRPSYPLHILIVPRARYRSLLEVPEEAAGMWQDLFWVVASLVEEFRLEERGYRLVLNGGSNQTVKQLHFHLLAEGEAGLERDSASRSGKP